MVPIVSKVPNEVDYVGRRGRDWRWISSRIAEASELVE